jgi:hypothetical protein
VDLELARQEGRKIIATVRVRALFQGSGSGTCPDDRAAADAHDGVMSAIEMRNHLQELETERALAVIEGLATSAAYMEDLDDEIAATRHAYIGAAVTEIAVLRAELSAPLLG